MKLVFDFEEKVENAVNILGGKGANLSVMSSIGLPVPEGFTVSTKVNFEFFKNSSKLPQNVLDEIDEAVKRLEKKSNQSFTDPDNPLLVSVRSGAPISMPGMMDTVLNLGINKKVAESIAKRTGNFEFAYDNYRRFIQMYSDVVLSIPKDSFDMVLDRYLENENVETFKELKKESMLLVIEDFLELVKNNTGRDFPEEAREQLILSVEAVFNSWKNERAVLYRKLNQIPDDLGTAVNVQRMVFGNYDEESGTGVLFTRNPASGENKLFGEFLFNAQGEDVVAGIRTPNEISELKSVKPEIYDELYKLSKTLEEHYKDMQDIEFTIERGKIYLLQTRNGKRTAKSAIKIALDLIKEKVISEEEALLRIDANSISSLLHPDFDDAAKKQATVLGKGLAASPGAASGKIYFTAEDIVEAKERGEKTILVRKETSPEDLAGMINSAGILTSRGGMTSHAAVVARSMGKTCVAGFQDLFVDEKSKVLSSGEIELREGDYISIDGYDGTVYVGDIKYSTTSKSDELDRILELSDKFNKTEVRANADTPKDAEVSISFACDGIGLCRTEHMFFEKDRITAVREMILARNIEERKLALDKVEPFQSEDFYNLLKVMKELPITVRLLDPPLHEFLPKEDKDISELASILNRDKDELNALVDKLHEFNPMLGHRGCRLAMTYPEVYEMQTRALIGAASKLKKEGIDTNIEIMIPLVAFEKELSFLKEKVKNVADEIIKSENIELNYKIGTMIEVPRACLLADEIAKDAEFFSFGTNDLTQMGLGFSRDDVGTFMNEYLDREVFEVDPFVSIDQKGIGQLLSLAVQNARDEKPNLKIGVCGEHGGDPASIEFFLKNKLDYVSCSPFRIPIAKLASAQHHIRKTKNKK